MGKIQNESQARDSSLFQRPLPGSDSDAAILLAIFGTLRTLTINGIFSGTLAEQNTFITNMEGIQAGNQTGSTFVSSQTSTANKTVFIQSFNWNFVAGNPNRVIYSLTLIEGAAVT